MLWVDRFQVLEQVPGELRFELGERRGAHVHQILDPVRLQARQKLVERARAVADGEKRGTFCRRCWRGGVRIELWQAGLHR